jgi:hypothetical protein
MATAALPTAPVGTPPPRGAQLPRVPSTELAIALERAAGLRLAAAERLVRSLPDMLGDALLGVELHFSAGGTFAAVARLAGDATALRQRLAFWCARAGARCLVPGDMPEEQRAAFRASLAQSEHSATAEPGAVAAEARRLFAEAGASPDRPEEATQPLLQLEVGGPEWKGVRWEPARSQLFVPGTLAPVEGDELTLCLRLTNEAGLRTRARVAEIRGPEQAGPGFPPGFTLSLLDPSSELLLSLDHHAEGAEAAYEKRRAHPRFAVRAPALVRAQAQAGADASPADEMLGPDGTWAAPSCTASSASPRTPPSR